MHVGRFYRVRVGERLPQGFYVETEQGDRVLLPNSKAPEGLELGEVIDAFIYLDSEDRPVATTETPLVEVNHFAVLEVTDVNRVGAFLDWGLDKDLFLPYKQQLGGELRPGDKCVVYVLEDARSGRLVATEKLKSFLETDISALQIGQKVRLAVYEVFETYAECLVNLRSGARLYLHPGEDALYIGDELDGYIEDIRSDGKITVSRFPVGYNTVRSHGSELMRLLRENGGKLPYGDHTAPEVIQEKFGLSKKAFKKLIGGLFKEGKIQITEAGIELPKRAPARQNRSGKPPKRTFGTAQNHGQEGLPKRYGKPKRY